MSPPSATRKRNQFVGHDILVTICAILFCRCCTAGASYSYLVYAAYPVLIRARSFFGSDSGDGSGYSVYATRVGVVCGAGLLYRKWYNENGYCVVGAINNQ